MRIIVTGSSGRVGRAIHIRLSRHYDVVGFDRSPSSTAEAIGDITDISLLRRVFSGADAIVHTAALHAPHVGIVSESEFERINVLGTRNVLDAADHCGVKQIVFTSTTALYGAAATPAGEAVWVDESLEPRPLTVYHRSKLAAEAILKSAADSGGPNVCILRMSRCFPEPAPIMAAFRLHRGIDARDVAEAHALALRHQGKKSATYVVSGLTPFHKEDVHDLLRNAPLVLQRRSPDLVRIFDERGWPLPVSIDRVYDSALAQAELGWNPQYGFSEVISMLDQNLPEVLPPGRVWQVDE